MAHNYTLERERRDLKTRGVHKGKKSDGEPSVEAGGGLAAAGGREGDEEEPRGDEAERGHEERAGLGEDLLHGHHGRSPEEEGRHQHAPLPQRLLHRRRRC